MIHRVENVTLARVAGGWSLMEFDLLIDDDENATEPLTYDNMRVGPPLSFAEAHMEYELASAALLTRMHNAPPPVLKRDEPQWTPEEVAIRRANRDRRKAERERERTLSTAERAGAPDLQEIERRRQEREARKASKAQQDAAQAEQKRLAKREALRLERERQAAERNVISSDADSVRALVKARNDQAKYQREQREKLEREERARLKAQVPVWPAVAPGEVREEPEGEDEAEHGEG